MSLWVKDPVSGLPSVSLTMLVISGAAVLAVGGLELSGVVKGTSIFTELFYTTTALYFGRRLNIGNKAVSAEKTE